MKKLISLVLSLVLALSLLLGLAGCGKEKKIIIAVPNDTTNEARALMLLESKGIIKLKDGAGITATVLDITENPNNIEFKEVEAAQIPNVLPDVDFAIINSNFAVAAGLSPLKDAVCLEDSYSAYGNILAVKKGREKAPEILALKAALESEEVAKFISENWKGDIVSTVKNPGSGYSDDIDYKALDGKTITIAASPTPHAEILKTAKAILEKKGIKLEIKEFEDYVQPNMVVNDGDCDANYFQHLPYLEDFNKEKGTDIVSLGAIHVEPMGIYNGEKQKLPFHELKTVK